MEPGETILGLDFGNHLWVVLSTATPEGRLALASLTTHGRQPMCGARCVVVRPGEHSYPVRDSCVYYRGVMMNPARPLDEAKRRGELRQREPFEPGLLLRIQRGALASPVVSPVVKDAVRRAIEGGG